MPYDHARKAGNRGDVWKHFTLVAVCDVLPVRQRFRYVDLHSGAPFHELQPRGEWRRGVGSVLDGCASLRQHGYFEIASAFVQNLRYPSGWWFAAERLATRCQHVDVVLTDLAEEVAARYAPSPLPGLRANVTVCFNQADGFRRARDLTKADLVLIDPPFSPDAAADWRSVAATCRLLLKQQIRFLAWYPVFSPTNPQRLVAATECSAWELTWAPFGPKPSQNLKGCGILASPDLTEVLRGTKASLNVLASCLGGKFSVRSHDA